MKVNRTSKFEIRLTPEMKAQWVERQRSEGFRSLSSFVEHCVESFLETGEEILAVEHSERSPLVVQKPPAQPTAPRGCEREGSHRVGSYCKACKRVIGKVQR